MKAGRFATAALAGLLLCASDGQAQQNVLRWGGDAEGGAPFVEADPDDPANVTAERKATELLRSLAVEHRKHAYPRELSGGEAQRVAIARSMAMDPPLLLMDEPTASLDPARRFELGHTLGQLTAGGRTLVLTTQDDDFAREFATRAVILAEGEVVEEGSAAEVLTSPQHPATRAFLQTEHTRLS